MVHGVSSSRNAPHPQRSIGHLTHNIRGQLPNDSIFSPGGKKSLNVKFKVCKSVHHRTIKINHQPDATIFQFIILTFI
jgi:hypothetical protein